MFKSILAVSLLLASTSAFAGKLYKCTDKNGAITYQKTICHSESDSQERLNLGNIKPSTGSKPRNRSSLVSRANAIDRKNDLETRKRKAAAYRSELARKRTGLKKSGSGCGVYKDYLADRNDEWRNTKRNGYKSWEKDLYKESVAWAERRIKRNCK